MKVRCKGKIQILNTKCFEIVAGYVTYHVLWERDLYIDCGTNFYLGSFQILFPTPGQSFDFLGFPQFDLPPASLVHQTKIK